MSGQCKTTMYLKFKKDVNKVVIIFVMFRCLYDLYSIE